MNIVLAPEANHKARQWSVEYLLKLCEILNENIVVVGKQKNKK